MSYLTANKKYFKWLYKQAETFKKNILICLVLSILAVIFSLLFAETTKNFIESVEKGEHFSLLLLAASLITIKGCHIFCLESRFYLKNKILALMNNALSLKFFKELLASSISYKDKLHSGDALSRITRDVGSVSNDLVEILPSLFYSLVQLSATCIYLASIEPALTLVIILIMPLNIMFGKFYTKKSLPISREIRNCDSKVYQFMQEHLQHHELIVTLDKASFIWNRLKSLQSTLYEKIITSTKLNTFTLILMDSALEINYILIFTWGIYGIQNNTFSYAELVVFLQLAEQIQLPFIQFNRNYPSFVSSIASVERLMEIENLPKEDNSNAIKFSVPVGIKFENVYFRYSEDARLIYKNFNYDFKPQSMTAILGETGAGKSTLLRLLLATLTPNSGSITFYGDGKNYLASPQTRCNCVYVPQGNSLISGTIRYNLLLGKTDANDEEMRNALELAAADFVFEDFPDGLDTAIGEGGVGVSEGQAQRIAIARSFLRPGKVILMDEPTSALDNETEKQFITRLTSQIHDKTIIIVTHKKEVCKYVNDVVTIELLREPNI